MSTPKCFKLEKALERIINKKNEFILLKLPQILNYQQMEMAKKKLLHEIEPDMEIIWPYEKTLSLSELKKQYNQIADTFIEVGLLRALKGGEVGYLGWALERRELPFPGFKAIIAALREQVPNLRAKTLQGFNRLLIFPQLDNNDLRLEGALKTAIEMTWPKDAFRPFQVPKIIEGDIKIIRGRSIMPTQPDFGPKYWGKRPRAKLVPISLGWKVVLAENSLTPIPRGKGRILNQRPQLEAGKTPDSYRRTLRQNSYRHEDGLSLSDWIIWNILDFRLGQQRPLKDYSYSMILLNDHDGGRSLTAMTALEKNSINNKLKIAINTIGDANSIDYCGTKTVVPIYKYEYSEQ